MITKSLQIHRIPGQISYYMDMTKPWKETNLAEDAFVESEYGHECDSLYIFTDGSVSKSMAGGYGYHTIISQDYYKIIKDIHVAEIDEEKVEQEEMENNRKERIKKYMTKIMSEKTLRYDQAQWLSDRCSVDFCEAYAIRDALVRVTREIRKLCDGFGNENYLKEVLNIRKIRIISDSQTVLNWINGSYTIRNPIMKGVVDDIIWQMACLKAENCGLEIQMNWVKAHEGTYGNEMADGLAKEEMQEVEEDNRWRYDRWSWYSLRAAKRTVMIKAKEYMAQKLREAILESEYSIEWKKYLKKETDFKENPIKWSKIRKTEMQWYSRDQMRLLIGIRSGHIKLNEYMCNRLNRTNSPVCRYCYLNETVNHILKDCKEPLRVQQRNKMIQVVKDLHEQRYQELWEQNGDQILWNLEDIDYQKLSTYIFSYRLDVWRQYLMIKELINLIRISLRNNNWMLQ